MNMSNLFASVLLVFILCFSSFLASDSKSENEYTYAVGTSKGPENWWRLDPTWKACGDGKFQSPIDLSEKRVHEAPQLGKLELDYKPAPAVLKNRGHDIMMKWNADAGKFKINGTYYELTQCHWHTPSEHTINGKRFAVELHAVHTNSKGEIAVIGLLYKIGKPDPFLSKILKNITSIRDTKGIDVGEINPEDMNLSSKRYYRYVGSLTTPPCTEDVIWTIPRKVGTVSTKQLKALKAVLHQGNKENARPTQQLGGREIWLYTPKDGQIFPSMFE